MMYITWFVKAKATSSFIAREHSCIWDKYSYTCACVRVCVCVCVCMYMFVCEYI